MAKGSHWGKHKYSEISDYCSDYIHEYRVWQRVIRRCTNKNCDMYYAYGGRGIKVCNEWLGEKGFVNFYKSLGKAPKEPNGRFYQIDRIDSNGDYCPENCRWVTALTNARNKRNSIKVWFMGDEYNLSELCKLFSLKRTSITEPVRLCKKTLEQSFAETFIRQHGGIELCAH